VGLFLHAAEVVLRQTEQPLTAKEITERARSLKLLDDSDGLTPHQTMKAKLSVDIQRRGERSRFMRTGRGKFSLRRTDISEYHSKSPLKTSSLSEQVLTVPADLIAAVGDFHGFAHSFKPYLGAILSSKPHFMIRGSAETDITHKQILTYVIIKHGHSVLRYVRGRYSSVDDFLKGPLCIGFGGHVNSMDLQSSMLLVSQNIIEHSVLRELSEELNLPAHILTHKNLRLRGVINDQSSFVGRTHFAFVFELLVPSTADLPRGVKLKREKSINQLQYVSIDTLGDDFARYEYWSKLCIRHLFRKDVRIGSSVQPIGRFRLRRHPDVIVVVGGMGSGKTEASRVLESRFGYQFISSRTILESLLGGPTLFGTDRSSFQEAALAFINKPDGPEQLGRALADAVLKAKRRCVIDGVRHLATLDALSRALQRRLSVIFVDSTIDSAFEFYRAREDKNVTFRQFVALREHEVEREVLTLVRRANLVVYNNGSKRSYLASIEKFLIDELGG